MYSKMCVESSYAVYVRVIHALLSEYVVHRVVFVFVHFDRVQPGPYGSKEDPLVFAVPSRSV